MYRLVLIILILITFGLTSCGMAVSVEERMRQAEQHMAAGRNRAAMIELKKLLANEPDNVTARLWLADVSLDLGDIELAEVQIQRAAQLSAGAKDIWPLHLRLLLAQGSYAEMLVTLSEMPDEIDQDTFGLFRAQALFGVGNYEKATVEFSTILRESPESSRAVVGFARSQAELGNEEYAIAALSEFLESHAADSGALLTLGILEYQRAEFEESVGHLQDAYKASNPETEAAAHAEILANLSRAYVATGQLPEAEMVLAELDNFSPNSVAGLWLGSIVARANGDLNAAVRKLQQLSTLSPGSTQTMLALASAQLAQGNVEQASNLLRQVIAVAPDNIQARKMLARAQLERANPANALEVLAPLLEEGDAVTLGLVANAKAQDGDLAAAIDELRAAVRVAPNDVFSRLDLAAAYLADNEPGPALEQLGSIDGAVNTQYRLEQLKMAALEQIGRSVEATTIAERLLAENSDSEIATIIAADFVSKSGNPEGAARVLREFRENHGAGNAFLNALGRLELSLGNMDSAEELFSEVLNRDSGNLGALLATAEIADQRGDKDGVVRFLEYAARENSDDTLSRTWLTNIYLSVSKLSRAEVIADELVALGADSPQALEVIGLVALESGRADDALVYLSRAAQLLPDSAKIRLNLAQGYLASGDATGARVEISQALELQPLWPPAMVSLALLELGRGRLDEAGRVADQLLSDQPNMVLALLLRGEIYLADGRNGLAADVFRQAGLNGGGRNAAIKEYQALNGPGSAGGAEPLRRWLESNPDDSETRSFVAQHLLQKSEYGKAIGEYEILRSHDPDNVIYINNLAWLSQQLGDLPTALKYAHRARELDLNSGSVADTLGWIYRDLGELDNSLELLNDASRLSPDNGEVKFHLATVLFESGRVSEAHEIALELELSGSQFPSKRHLRSLIESME